MAIDICNIVPKAYFSAVRGRARHLVLAHLLDTDIEYRNFYKSEAEKGSVIYIDNSNYECGDDWCSPEYLIRIYDLFNNRPYLMAPEKAFNSSETIESVKQFTRLLKDKNRTDILVFSTVHGTNLSEISDCYSNVEPLS